MFEHILTRVAVLLAFATAAFADTSGATPMYTISFEIGGDTVQTGEYAEGDLPVYTGETPTKESDRYYDYSLKYWYDANYAGYMYEGVHEAYESTSYKAEFERNIRFYTVTLLDDDGSVLEIGHAPYGGTFHYSVKPRGDDDYTWLGWRSTDESDFFIQSSYFWVDGDTTYTSWYDYRIRFNDADGKLLCTGWYGKGETPNPDSLGCPEKPTKKSTAEYAYEFDGWDKPLAPVTTPTTYTAKFKEIPLKASVIDIAVGESWPVDTKNLISLGDTGVGIELSKDAAVDLSQCNAVQYDFIGPSHTFIVEGVDGSRLMHGTIGSSGLKTETVYRSGYWNNVEPSIVFAHAARFIWGDFEQTGDMPAFEVSNIKCLRKPAYTAKFFARGELLGESTYAEGEEPNPSDKIYNRIGDIAWAMNNAEYRYDFGGWSVTGDTVYNANFIKSPRTYSFGFCQHQDEWGSCDETSWIEVGPGEIPVYNGPVPTRDADDIPTYGADDSCRQWTFDGSWRTTRRVGDATVYWFVGPEPASPENDGRFFEPNFTCTEKRKYTVTFKDSDGSVISSKEYEYNDLLDEFPDPVRGNPPTEICEPLDWTTDWGDSYSPKDKHHVQRDITLTPNYHCRYRIQYDIAGDIFEEYADSGTSYKNLALSDSVWGAAKDISWSPSYSKEKVVSEPMKFTAVHYKVYAKIEIGEYFWELWVDESASFQNFVDQLHLLGYFSVGEGANEKIFGIEECVTISAEGDTSSTCELTHDARYAGMIVFHPKPFILLATKYRSFYPVRFVDDDGTLLSFNKDSLVATLPFRFPDPPDETSLAGPRPGTFPNPPPPVFASSNNDLDQNNGGNVGNCDSVWFYGSGSPIDAVLYDLGFPEAPSKTRDGKTYTFDAWGVSSDTLNGPTTFVAAYKTADDKYTVYFMRGDSILQRDELSVGEMPEFRGDVSKLDYSDDVYTYKWKGWDVPIVEVDGAAVYCAIFDKVPREYEVVFLNDDGTELYRNNYLYYYSLINDKNIPTEESILATKTGDVRFLGWQNGMSHKKTEEWLWNRSYIHKNVKNVFVNGAGFLKARLDYKITFKNYDGTVLGETWESSGANLKENLDRINAYDSWKIAKPSTDEYDYVWKGKDDITKGWDKEITEVSNSVVYTVAFDSIKRQYEVSFVDDDGSQNHNSTVLKEPKAYDYGTKASDIELPESPTKEPSIPYTYSFAGWVLNGKKGIQDVTGNATYVATWTATLRQYSVLFVDEDGKELKAKLSYDYATDSAAIEVPEAPVKEGYDFAGWTPKIGDVVGDVIYRASYVKKPKTEFVITWRNDDGTLLHQNTFSLNQLPSYEWEYPTKEPTAANTFVFEGWTPSISVVTDDAEYVASYTSYVRKYWVSFKYKGRVSAEKDAYDYNTPVSDIELPNIPDTAMYDCVRKFIGWSPEISVVTEDAYYEAQYSGCIESEEVSSSSEPPVSSSSVKSVSSSSSSKVQPKSSSSRVLPKSSSSKTSTIVMGEWFRGLKLGFGRNVLSVTSLTPSDIHIQVFDMMGQLITNFDEYIVGSKDFDLSRLKRGNYIVRLVNESDQKAARISIR